MQHTSLEAICLDILRHLQVPFYRCGILSKCLKSKSTWKSQDMIVG